MKASFLIVGLGNPGTEYVGSRHNVGRMVIDRISTSFDVDILKDPKGGVARISPQNRSVVLFKPPTFMNSSGPAVARIMKTYPIDGPQDILVVHDDIDLDFGGLILKEGGGSGGHRGIESIVATLGTDGFKRLRVGVGRPPGRMDPADFVLSPFSKKERPEIEVTVAQAAEAAVAVAEDGLQSAINRYNRRRL